MMSHETNTFSNVPTDRAQFEARHLHYGGEVLEAFGRTGTCLGGMIESAVARGATLVPSVAAAASPAPPPFSTTPRPAPPPGTRGTARGPMRRLYDLADRMEGEPRVLSVSIFAGFPFADIPDAGLGIYVATDDDPALAARLAAELARVAWEHRQEFVHTALPVGAAVARALAAEGGPIVLADM